MKINYCNTGFVCLLWIAGLAPDITNAQPDLTKLKEQAKKLADDAKKKYGNSQNKDDMLPPGYDNSWRMQVSISTVLTSQTDLKRNYNDPSHETKKGTATLQFQAGFSAEKNISWSNGDDIQISSYDTWDDKFKKFGNQPKGNYSINWQISENNSTNNSSYKTALSGNGQADPALADVRFEYNKKTKQGDLTINNENFDLNGNGSVTACDKANGCHTEDGKDISVAAANMYTLVFRGCQLYSSFDIMGKNAGRDALEKSVDNPANVLGVNMGIAKITENDKHDGYTIAFSNSKTDNTVPDGWTGTNTFTATTNVTISFTLSNPSQYDAVLESVSIPNLTSEDYDNWLPLGPSVKNQGGSQSMKPGSDKGNSIAFRVRILDRKNKDADVTSSHPFTLIYSLSKVSNYKGFCMNYPLKDNADDKPDFRWDEASKSASALDHYTEDKLISKTRKGDQLMAVITSYDYAAYGVLTANVHLENENIDLDAYFKETPGQYFVTLPKDENKNKIADKWEKDVGMFGKTADANFDEDEYPKNQKRNGDGYTLFEEYRGFKVNDNLFPSGSHETFIDQHLRMDPNYKDIFINDRDGLFTTYYKPHNPSDLCWHYIDNNEIVYFGDASKSIENRWVNFNKTDQFYARQYALILVDDKVVPQNCTCADVEVGKQESYGNFFDWNMGKEEEQDETYLGFDQAVKHTIIIKVHTGVFSYCIKKFIPQAKQDGAFDQGVRGTVCHEIGHAIGINHHMPLPEIGSVICCMRYSTQDEVTHGTSLQHPYYCKRADADGGNDCYGKIDVKCDPD